MASEGIFSIFVESVVEDVIKQHGTRPSDIDMASRRAEEAAARRYEAAAWLRRTVGVVGAKDLPEEPSEEEFRIGLRNGIILCNALNKVQPGAIPKVVEAPPDSFVVPDGAPLTAYQYFENLRNFLVTLEGMGLSTFEASDLERGGKGSRVVDSVLALKFYIEAKQAGKDGSSKFGGTSKPASLAKHFIRKSCEPFMNSISRSHLLNEKPHEDLCLANNFGGDYLSKSVEMKCSHSLNLLVRTVLSNKKPEEVPLLVESMLNKVMQEFELCIADQSEMGLAPTTILKENQHVKEAAENEWRERLNNQQEKEAEMKELKERLLLMEHRLKQQEQDFRMQRQGNGMEEKTLEDMEEKALRLQKQQKWEMEQTEINDRLIKQHLIFDRQQKEIKELKLALSLTKVGMEDMKSQYLEEFSNLGKQLGTLANAASKYHKVLEENRKLYNQIQDLKGNIRVYCRVRPFLHGQVSNMSTISRIDDQNITIASASKNGKDARRNFTFNKVFGPTATQEEIFSDTQPLIRSVLDGYNVCIFAYGQTGSGKTHTMSGPKELNEKTIGVNYRALNDLFYLLEQRMDTFFYEISVQMLEIYNEQVRDLLSDDLSKRLEIRNSTNKGLSVPDANIVPVRSTAEVIEIMNIGQKNRAVSSTAMNDRSSRSHSCLTIHVQGKELTSGNMLRGCMHLVDLAGSERVDKSEVKGDRLKEAQHINKSLAALGDVIASLAQKSAHVPYRNSKLTQLLQDSLGGQAKTLMFVHISPEADALSETLSTLKFAERVATVELGAARVNKDNVEVKELKEQIAALKATMTNKGADEPLRTTVSSLDLSRMKPSIVTTNHEEDEIGYPTSNRKPMEEVGNIENIESMRKENMDSAMNKSQEQYVSDLFLISFGHARFKFDKIRGDSNRQKQPDNHSEEMLISMESPWPDSYQELGDDDKEAGSGEWVDKVVVNNKVDATSREGDGAQDQNFFQRYINDVRVYPELQLINNGGGKKASLDSHGNQFDFDSEDLENSTSDSSEVELLSQLNVSKIPRGISGGMSKIKKPQANGSKSTDGRNLSNGHVPSPSRKVLNGPNQTTNRTMRQPVSLIGDGKRSSLRALESKR